MSIERDPTTKNNNAWQWGPKVSLKDFTSAYQWLGKRKQTLNCHGKYLALAGDKFVCWRVKLKLFGRDIRNFDNFAIEGSKIWYTPM